MARVLMIISIVLLTTAFVLFQKSRPWKAIDLEAAADAEAFASLIARPDRIAWRLTENLTLNHAILWDADAKLRFPAPDGFTPLIYEFSKNEMQKLARLQASLTAPTWQWFDTSKRELLHCRPSPAICLVYERVALERKIGHSLEDRLFPRNNRLLRAILLILAAVSSGLAIWVRRTSPNKPSSFKLLPERHVALRGAQEFSLTPRDLKILSALSARSGAVVTKDELYDAGWGREFMPNSRALDQHMINLRRKLDPDKSLPVLIETVHGVGYRLVQ